MNRLLLLTILSLFIISGCKSILNLNQTLPREHIQKSAEFENIMHKFDNLIFQHFQSELERDEKRIFYTLKMVTLVDELVVNSRELQKQSNQHSIEFTQFANALEDEAKKLKTSLSNYQTEEIAVRVPCTV